MKRALAKKQAQLYVIDAIKIAQGLGLHNRTNTILQASFFQLSQVIPIEKAVAAMKEAIHHSYFKTKGQKIVDINNASIEYGITELHKIDIPEGWLNAQDQAVNQDVPEFISEIVAPMTLTQMSRDETIKTFEEYKAKNLPLY